MSRGRKDRASMHQAGGHYWPTLAAADRCRVHLRRRADNLIVELELHPRIELSEGRVPYTADFSYLEQSGALVFEDFNTGRDPRLKDIVRLWASYGPGILTLVRPSRRRPGEYEETRRIVPDERSQ